ncbi:MAG: hypothetical protein FJ276_32995 [Planctomycetes bacterium]|nr:hypothetical protein [Planctomycetota bacterium]
MAAGDAVVKGTNDFTEQPYGRKWTKSGGWTKVRQWEGPYDNSKIATLLATIEALSPPPEDIEIIRGWPTQVRASFPDDTGEPTLGTADDLAEWSLESYDLEKALGTHGKFHGSGVSASGIAAIDAMLKRGEAYNVDLEELFAEGAASNYNKYRDLKGVGVESYVTDAYVLRRTLTCSRTSTYLQEWQAAADKLGKIIAWNEIGVPSSAKIEQPWTRIYVASIWGGFKFRTGSAGGWADVYFDEWRVKAPSVRWTREGRAKRRQIVQEYIGALGWSSTLYDGGKGSP